MRSLLYYCAADFRIYMNRFCDTYQPNKDNGFIVKLPFTTNQQYNVKSTVEKVYDQINYVQSKWKNVIPYVMIQPYLTNKKEYKVFSDILL